MKRTINAFLSLVLAVGLALSMQVTAFAAESSITYYGRPDGFDVQSDSQYTATDLFGNFKDVMPGDKLEEVISIKNAARTCDYIRLYLKVIIHDENGNPLSYDEAFEGTDGKDQTNIDGQRGETVTTMQDFLSQLTMRIYSANQLIYESSPDEAGALVENVLLGTVNAREKLTLRVELDVPSELGNKYANRVGEVDWVITAHEYEHTIPKTGDDSGFWLILWAFSLIGIIVLLLLDAEDKRRCSHLG